MYFQSYQDDLPSKLTPSGESFTITLFSNDYTTQQPFLTELDSATTFEELTITAGLGQEDIHLDCDC